VTLENYFLDGTKIEANANKYKWVWAKSTAKDKERRTRRKRKPMGTRIWRRLGATTNRTGVGWIMQSCRNGSSD
jgi:hypothetical protein